jgi:hypothetical protein
MPSTSNSPGAVAVSSEALALAHDLCLDEPVIVLTCARAGSTLLRFLLDAHPELACPPETNLPRTVSHHAASWRLLNGSDQLPQEAIAAIRAPLDGMFRQYLSKRGRQRWCDKSLGTAETAAAFLDLYPDAQFICLYRHCMDVVASGIEACPQLLHITGQITRRRFLILRRITLPVVTACIMRT